MHRGPAVPDDSDEGQQSEGELDELDDDSVAEDEVSPKGAPLIIAPPYACSHPPSKEQNSIGAPELRPPHGAIVIEFRLVAPLVPLSDLIRFERTYCVNLCSARFQGPTPSSRSSRIAPAADSLHRQRARRRLEMAEGPHGPRWEHGPARRGSGPGGGTFGARSEVCRMSRRSTSLPYDDQVDSE